MGRLPILAVILLAGCAEYTAPPLYTEAEVSSCKTKVTVSRIALLPAALIPVLGTLVSSGLQDRNDAIHDCLAENHADYVASH